MQVDLIVVGKLNSNDLISVSKDYQTRISSFVKFNIIELKECTKKNNIEENLAQEEKSIMSKISDKTYLYICDVRAKKLDSIQFAKQIEKTMEASNHIVFLIGSSNGISKNIKQRANNSISFSDMTFPHKLFRIMFLEQLYRGYTIINNQSYHK
ncbi:MAG: 23S rRNA (pseudouridine(1915)-N(3))-methyltransferase RlmH [Mycoplasmatales bacterium]